MRKLFSLLGCSVLMLVGLGAAGCAGIGVPAQEINVSLSGGSEVPPNRSAATGKGTFWVHTDRTLNGFIETSGMEASAAHLHLGAAGANGAVVLELVRTSNAGPIAMEHFPISGASWSVSRSARLDEEQYAAFIAGEIYVHVHSASYPEGEIRGQLRP